MAGNGMKTCTASMEVSPASRCHLVCVAFNWIFYAEIDAEIVDAVCLMQIQQLYVSDPLALQHICIKDQQSFDETELFLT